MPKKRYVVIGEGAAGMTAAEELRRLEPQAAIGVFSEEPHPSYFRAALTNYLLGELREDQLWVNPPNFFESQSIRRAFARVVRVDAARGELWDSSSTEPTPFDALLVASGARARTPSFEGAGLLGVVTLRTLFDARVVMDSVRLRGLSSAVILGAGPLGLEWAHALLERGSRVTLVERANRLMPSALDEVASDLVAARLRQAGIELALGDEVLAARPGQNGSVGGVVLRSGRQIGCELVAAALGVLPNSEFLQSTGIRLSATGAVAVDRTLQSSLPNVWAAGDVANVDGQELALWEPAKHQGRIAARNMAGSRFRYEPGAHYFATRLFDLDFARIGDIRAAPGREEVVDFPRGTGKVLYRKLVLEGGVLVGALMLGERALRVRSAGRALKELIDAKANVTSIKDRVFSANFDLAGWLQTKRLVLESVRDEKTQAHALPVAKLRGTQALRLPSGTGSMAMPILAPKTGATGTRAIVSGTRALVPQTAPPGGPAPAPSAAGPRATRMLSIGLHAEASAVQAPVPVSLHAALEYGGQQIAISRAITSLGQSADADVRLADPNAASLHAQIVEHEGRFYLRDLGSQFGTWVNQKPLNPAEPLADGDRLQIGQQMLIFRSAGARAAANRTSALVSAPRLTVRSGAKLGLSLRLPEHGVLIGSAPGSALCLTDPGVSPQHARVHQRGPGFVCEILDGTFGSWLRGQPLSVGAVEALREGDWLRLGTVDFSYSELPAEDASRALAPSAKLTVDSGPTTGQSAAIPERALVGSAPNATFVIPGVAPNQLEILRHGRAFFARDLSAGQTLRAGRPLGAEWSQLEHGNLLLLAGSTLLRFEEV
jgi:NADPH-dependent 2,4-dienoyl-CoA reductase/sulfur reductase-like enzyme/pSer/pThr/pTyr-binding forkhead associated (FHA) protein